MLTFHIDFTIVKNKGHNHELIYITTYNRLFMWQKDSDSAQDTSATIDSAEDLEEDTAESEQPEDTAESEDTAE